METSIRSEHLNDLRKLVKAVSDIEDVVGAIFQVRLVVDTNAVLSDLLWMVKRNKEESKTAFLEVIQAGTLIAYAPHHLKDEVEKHLPRLADKKNLELENLREEWRDYRENLEFVEIDDSQLKEYEDSVDPKDAPFVVLAEMLGVKGVISNDKHIEMMGGNRINVDVRIALRDYSRSAAVSYTLKIGGFYFSLLSVGLVIALAKGVKALVSVINGLPDSVKTAILACVVLAFVFPSSRKKIFDYLKSMKAVSVEAWKKIDPIMSDLFQLASEKREEVKLHKMKIDEHLS